MGWQSDKSWATEWLGIRRGDLWIGEGWGCERDLGVTYRFHLEKLGRVRTGSSLPKKTTLQLEEKV